MPAAGTRPKADALIEIMIEVEAEGSWTRTGIARQLGISVSYLDKLRRLRARRKIISQQTKKPPAQ